MKLVVGDPFDVVKAKRLAEIDAGAEAFRHRFLTPGSGQALVYQQKAGEAAALFENLDIADEAIPHIVAEVGINAETREGAAALILATRDQWVQLSARIERLRLGAKAAVRAATNAHELAAISPVDWDEALGG
jgi:hypothetical protein